MLLEDPRHLSLRLKHLRVYQEQINQTLKLASLIRTANKNEQLLEAKLNKRKNKTGRVGKKQIDSGSANKNKTIRAFNINSRLDGKIEKAVNRARYVQSARKAGWETTNSNIRKELDVLQGKTTDDKDAGDEKEVDLMDNDEEEPYSSANLESTVTPVPKETVNAFAALDDEVEA